LVEKVVIFSSKLFLQNKCISHINGMGCIVALTDWGWLISGVQDCMAARVAGKKISILLVEGSNDQRELIGDTLSDYGYLVTTVSGCKPAGA
jgi:hypothetical protein